MHTKTRLLCTIWAKYASSHDLNGSVDWAKLGFHRLRGAKTASSMHACLCLVRGTAAQVRVQAWDNILSAVLRARRDSPRTICYRGAMYCEPN